MSARVIIAGAVGVSLLVVPGQTVADPRESCRILVDPKGDADGSGGAGVFRMRSTDIVSADVASTKEYLTAAIRVDDLSARGSEAQMIGAALEFTVNRSRFAFQAVESTTRLEFTVWRKTGPGDGAGAWSFLSYATGAFNDDDSAMYITLPLSRLGVRGNSGYSATDLRAVSAYGYDAAVMGTAARADEAFGTGRYRLGSPSCSPAPVEPCREPQPRGIPPQDPCPGGG